MVYISASGTLSEKRSPYRISIIADIFWAIVNFFGLFFSSLFASDPDEKKVGSVHDSEGGDGRGGDGKGGGHKRPGESGSNVRGMRDRRRDPGQMPAGGG